MRTPIPTPPRLVLAAGLAVAQTMTPNLATAASFTLEHPDPIASGNFGRALVTDDFNADGRTDLAIVASQGSDAPGQARVYLYLNPRGGAPSYTIPANDAQYHNGFGRAMTSGDFDGDGHRDLAVSTVANPLSGRVDIYLGTPEGPRASRHMADTVLRNPGALGPADGLFGDTLAACDLNGDRYDDLVVGAGWQYLQVTPEGETEARQVDYAGEVFIHFGPDLTRVERFHAQVPREIGFFGRRLDCGDVNGDGIADLLVGKPGDMTVLGNPGSGATTFHHGSSELFLGARDGRPTPAGILVPRDLGPGLPGYRVTVGDGETFGLTGLLADFNNDGYDDAVVGAPHARGGKGYAAWESGPEMQTHALLELPEPTDLAADARFAVALIAGDLDGNGTPEVLVGAPGSGGSRDAETTDAGRVYAYAFERGAFRQLPKVFADPDPGVLDGTLNDTFGTRLAVADLTGDGRYDELAVAVPAATIDAQTKAGKVVVFLGPVLSDAEPTPACTELPPGRERFNRGCGYSNDDWDADGIFDSVDTLPRRISAAFDNGAGTRGSVLQPSGAVRIRASDSASDNASDSAGVRVDVPRRTLRATTISACADRVRLNLDYRDAVDIACGDAAAVRALRGTIGATFRAAAGAIRVNLDIPAGNGARFEGTRLSADADNTHALYVQFQGTTYRLTPGASRVFRLGFPRPGGGVQPLPIGPGLIPMPTPRPLPFPRP